MPQSRLARSYASSKIDELFRDDYPMQWFLVGLSELLFVVKKREVIWPGNQGFESHYGPILLYACRLCDPLTKYKHSPFLAK